MSINQFLGLWRWLKITRAQWFDFAKGSSNEKFWVRCIGNAADFTTSFFSLYIYWTGNFIKTEKQNYTGKERALSLIIETKQVDPNPTSKEPKELFNKDHWARTWVVTFAFVTTQRKQQFEKFSNCILRLKHQRRQF